jgi:hypothetical protein
MVIIPSKHKPKNKSFFLSMIDYNPQLIGSLSVCGNNNLGYLTCTNETRMREDRSKLIEPQVEQFQIEGDQESLYRYARNKKQETQQNVVQKSSRHSLLLLAILLSLVVAAAVVWSQSPDGSYFPSGIGNHDTGDNTTATTAENDISRTPTVNETPVDVAKPQPHRLRQDPQWHHQPHDPQGQS